MGTCSKEVSNLGSVCAPKIALLGANCGGLLLNPSLCELDAECKLSTSNPDFGGVCVKKSFVGKDCNHGHVNSCGPNAFCDNSITLGVGGVCILNPAAIGVACGGNVATNPTRCELDAVCKLLNPFLPDLGGLCVKKPAEILIPIGGSCSDRPEMCVPGAVCYMTSISDPNGVCGAFRNYFPNPFSHQ